MVKPLQQFLLGASVCIGAAIFSTPAFAGSLTNATVTGTASYLTYDADAKNTFLVPNDPSNLTKILSGSATSPTGNVELFSNSEQLSNTTFQAYTGVSTLSGKIGGLDISLSSLTATDWGSTVGGKTLRQTWFESAMQASGLDKQLSSQNSAAVFNIFSRYGGFQRFSDPNVAYVNQDATGLIRIGLAGHLNATPMIVQSLTTFLADSTANSTSDKAAKTLVKNVLIPALSNVTVQASELIKYSYNGTSGYLYSFSGTNSGLVEKGDGVSHNANYEVTINGVPPQDVPEPSLLLGLMGVGGALLSKRTSAKKMRKSSLEA